MLPLTIHTRSGAIARILPEVGFNCFQLRIPGDNSLVEVLDFTEEFESSGKNPNHNGIPLLFPFPNRIRDGKYSWDGREYQITGIGTDGRGHPIHGLVIDRSWRVVSQGDDFVVGQFQLSLDAPDRRSLWPADFLIEVRYQLAESVLRCDIRVANPDRVPLPWGFGTHPYFRIPLSSSGQVPECLIQAPASEEWELIDCLPTGRRRPVAGRKDLREGQSLDGLKLDDVFTGLTASRDRVVTVVMDPQAGLQVTQQFDPIFRELVVYTPPHGRSVCLEPYTCVTDAVNLQGRGIDAGWRVLPPGEELRMWFEIIAGPVFA